MKRIASLLLFLLLIFTVRQYLTTQHKAHENIPTQAEISKWAKVVEYAQQNLPLQGQLVAKKDGFVYLKVDDQYIYSLYPMLDLAQDGFKKPPFFRTREAPGAHITVFYHHEHVIPQELGQTFHFKLKKISIVNTKKGSSYAILRVESPELEKLREEYGLKPNPRGHDFHITLAKKYPRKWH